MMLLLKSDARLPVFEPAPSPTDEITGAGLDDVGVAVVAPGAEVAEESPKDLVKISEASAVTDVPMSVKPVVVGVMALAPK